METVWTGLMSLTIVLLFKITDPPIVLSGLFLPCGNMVPCKTMLPWTSLLGFVVWSAT